MDSVIEQIEQIYQTMGQQQYGEAITQTEHAVQCAELARRAGADSELIVAALLHDIGHLVEQISVEHGNFKHDKVGADWLAQWFRPQVTEPIRLHAQAKRYLCTVETGYEASLSEASRYSLGKQGGLMNTDECTDFEQQPTFLASLQLRRWDDEGKDPEMAAIAFDSFRAELTSALALAAGE
ncbi:MAG: HD domain-containing protein [Marinobacterium sp.]|nr:HD domain-containing protein [Marinobacterium sp.]